MAIPPIQHVKMRAPNMGCDPVRGAIERRLRIGSPDIDNTGGALYSPQNPDNLIFTPYISTGEQYEREERAENPCGMTDAEWATACFFADQATREAEDFWTPEPDSLTLIPYDEWEDKGFLVDDGMSCSLTDAGVAAVYGDSETEPSLIVTNIDPTLAFNSAATGDTPEASHDISPPEQRPAANTPRFALQA